jgi:hypothetical protein
MAESSDILRRKWKKKNETAREGIGDERDERTSQRRLEKLDDEKQKTESGKGNTNSSWKVQDRGAPKSGRSRSGVRVYYES